MIFPGPIVIFPKLHIQHPMLLIYAPMLSHTPGKSFQVGETIIAGLYGRFIADDPR